MTIGALLLAVAAAPEPAPAMARAASAFLASLDEGDRAAASLPFDSENRLDWHYVPRRRKGVSLKQLSAAQRQAALALLKEGLSAKGFAKVETIRSLEEVLHAIEGSSVRDPGLYHVTVFGAPSAGGAWGLRYEGHHVSLHWTIVSGRVAASTPQFLGADPADVRTGARRGTRALAAEEDLGRALVKSLRPDQRARAVVSASAPSDILTGASRDPGISGERGIAYTDLSSDQQGMLLGLLEEYASLQTQAVAQARMAKIRSELPRIAFAWMGGLDKGEGHYYRIQGATFLIEYDNTQDDANHIHCVWRELKGDWGRDLLADHYRTGSHGR